MLLGALGGRLCLGGLYRWLVISIGIGILFSGWWFYIIVPHPRPIQGLSVECLLVFFLRTGLGSHRTKEPSGIF
jgi:hypothetical protein